jgi:hypothetical protein
MSWTTVRGDIFLTHAHAIAIGLNASGRLGVEPVYTALQDRHPVFVSECHKRGRAGLLVPGSIWIWREAAPWLVGLVVRETPPGSTRLRYVETAMLNLYKDWEREGVHSLALMRLASADEWPGVRAIVHHYLAQMALSVTVYDDYLHGVAAEDTDDGAANER